MRHLVIGLGLLLPALPAQATIIELGPNFFIIQDSGPSFEIENLALGTPTTDTSVSGSGSAVSIVNDWDDAEIRTELGAGPGEATASLVNTATFDLVFSDPGDVEIAFGFGLDGLGDAGLIDTDPGDSSFASWDLFLDVEGFGGLIGESQEHQCVDGVAIVGDCFNFFDFSQTLLVDTLPDDLTLTVSSTMRFDIGVSRAAVAVPAPGALAFLLVSLAWIGRRKFAAA